MRPTRAIINLSRLESNIRNTHSVTLPGTEFMAVIKANAYGHGIYKIAERAVRSGATWLGVALPEEGAALRESGIKAPILILGEIDEEQCMTVLEYNLTQAVPSLSTAVLLNEAAAKVNRIADVHLKLDTGMGRIGFRSTDSPGSILSRLAELTNLHIDGVFTHFASADEEDTEFTKKQIGIFNDMNKTIREYGFRPRYIHASNSAGIFGFPEAHYNMVRGGIVIYGYYPSDYIKKHTDIKLMPVLQWETKVVHVKSIQTGDSVSYGRTYTASGERVIATLPVGYADGYSRLLGNKADVLIHGRRAPVIGRVCMDQLMIDVTDIPGVAAGDTAVLLGEQGNDFISADELADICGTISYEILTSIGNRVPRVYLD